MIQLDVRKARQHMALSTHWYWEHTFTFPSAIVVMQALQLIQPEYKPENSPGGLISNLLHLPSSVFRHPGVLLRANLQVLSSQKQQQA